MWLSIIYDKKQDTKTTESAMTFTSRETFTHEHFKKFFMVVFHRKQQLTLVGAMLSLLYWQTSGDWLLRKGY